MNLYLHDLRRFLVVSENVVGRPGRNDRTGCAWMRILTNAGFRPVFAGGCKGPE